jgi:predicted  nucleic acid-binding Zn-ribbon protein
MHEFSQGSSNLPKLGLTLLTRLGQELVRKQGQHDGKDCASKIDKLREDMAKYKNRAKEADEVREEFDDVNQDLEAEKKKSFEMELKVKNLGDKLEQTKVALKEIERQRQEADQKYDTVMSPDKSVEASRSQFQRHMADSHKEGSGPGAEKAKAALQKDVLATLSRMRGVGPIGDIARKIVKDSARKAIEAGTGGSGGHAGDQPMVGDRLREVQRLISKMNLDLSAKSQTIAELAEEKREAERSVRRLESKLIEAGVSPDHLEKVKTGAPGPKKEFNPALAAASQVVGGAGVFDASQDILNAKVDVVFGKVDDNGDQTIDFVEFKKALHHSGFNSAMEAKLTKSKFDSIDRDRTGYITLEEAYSSGSKFLPMFEGLEIGAPQNWVQPSGVGGSGHDSGEGAGSAAGDKEPFERVSSAARIASKRGLDSG